MIFVGKIEDGSSLMNDQMTEFSEWMNRRRKDDAEYEENIRKGVTIMIIHGIELMNQNTYTPKEYVYE